MRQHRSRDVVSLIKQYILEHHLHPGDPMPTENELTEALDVSRSGVREAIKTLAALDIVDVRHGYGTYVGSMSLRALVESLAFRGLLNSPGDVSLFSELVDMREVLEKSLAAATIDATSDAQLKELRNLADQMVTKAGNGEEFLEEDRRFHLTLMEPTGNNLAVQFTGAFWDIHSIVSAELAPIPDLRKSAQAHLDIVNAAVKRDVSALQHAITQHYQPIRSRLARSDVSN